jgi:HAD superfamily hydrolase (TIGR01509 family)
MYDGVLHTGKGCHRIPAQHWLNTIVSGGYRAVIFDCDGTLVDSADAHFASFQAALRAQGHALEREWYTARAGLDRRATIEAFATTAPTPVDVERAIAQSIKAFLNDSTGIKPIPGMTDLVKALSSGHPLAVGTNAESTVAEASLKAVGLLGYFESVVSISDGLRPKPAPDIFDTARERLGYPAEQTLVFEDSAEGVQAARTAGLDVLQLVPIG